MSEVRSVVGVYYVQYVRRDETLHLKQEVCEKCRDPDNFILQFVCIEMRGILIL